MNDRELAWRDGFLSALNCIRAADTIVRRERIMSKPDAQFRRVVSEMIGVWCDTIENEAMENVVKAARKEDFGVHDKWCEDCQHKHYPPVAERGVDGCPRHENQT